MLWRRRTYAYFGDRSPARCSSCGRYTFYDPTIAKRDPFMAHLIRKDNGK